MKRGRVRGHVDAHEDEPRLRAILLSPLPGANAVLRVHGDLRMDPEGREAERARKLARIEAGLAKRWVLETSTAAGTRIVKVSEPRTLGSRVQGITRSVGKREHRAQVRAEGMALAMARSCGYLELWGPLWPVRSIQVQDSMRALPSVETYLREHTGSAAITRVAVGLARTHALGFFHADLKGFHAFVDPEIEHLRWLDLGRVSFRLTERRRVINLYQALRFWLPADDDVQAQFIESYGEALNMNEARRRRLLQRTRELLQYKLRTHPVVE